jgi:hypothetical protein
VEIPPETCRAVSRYKINCVTLHLVGYILDKNGHFPKHGIWIEINFKSLIINKMREIMSSQAQRSNQKYYAFLVPVNHVSSIANSSVTKALGLKIYFTHFK